MKKLILLILTIYYVTIPSNVYSQESISGWLNFDSISLKVERIKKLDLDFTWKNSLASIKSKKALYSSIDIKNKKHKILLIPDVSAISKSYKYEPVFKRNDLARNVNLGRWIVLINGKQIGQISIYTIENGKITEYRFMCSQELAKDRWYEKRINKRDENQIQYSGKYWAHSWDGDYYFGSNPSQSEFDAVYGQIIYHNGDLFYGYVNRDFELDNEGKYVFKSHPKYSEYKGYFDKSKFDDSRSRQGHSSLYFKDGTLINGSFLQGDINVKVKCFIKYPNGDRYSGYVSKDFVRNGEGEIAYNSGGGYLGNWSNDFRIGNGKVLYDDGIIIEGVWDKNKLVDLHDKKTLHSILPKEANDNLSVYRSRLGDFKLQKKEYSVTLDCEQILSNEGIIEVTKITGDEKLDSKLGRTNCASSPYIKTIRRPCGTGIGRYVAQLEKTKTNLLIVKFIEIHKNNILNYTLKAKSLKSTINHGKFEGLWVVQTNLGYSYDIEFNNGEPTYIKYIDKNIRYEVKREIIGNSKVFKGTYTEIMSDKVNDTLVYQAIWNHYAGSKMLQGLHLLNRDTIYFGDYENDKRHGIGTAVLRTKNFNAKGYFKYRGQWCDNQIYGFGAMLLKNNIWKHGYWRESNEIDMFVSGLPKNFDLKYKSYNNHLSTFRITGSQIEVVDKILDKRAKSPSINLFNTSAIQRPNGVVDKIIVVPRKTGYISFQESNCNISIYRIEWRDGSIENLTKDSRGQIIGITKAK